MQTLTERTYLPSDYLDEMPPQTRATPSDWIARLADGALMLAGDDDSGIVESPIKLGDVVQFCWTERYDPLVLTITEHETFSVAGTPDPRADCFCAGDPDSFANSLAEFAEQWVQDIGEPGEVEIAQYTWSGGEPWRLDLVDGVARFVPVSGNAT